MKTLKQKIRKFIEKLFKFIDPLPFNYLSFYRTTRSDFVKYKKTRKLYIETKKALKKFPYKIRMNSYKVELWIWNDDLKKDNKTAIQAMNEISNALLKSGFSYYMKWKFEYNMLRAHFQNPCSSFWTEVQIDMDDKCEIETIIVERQETVVTGLCAKAMEEINN